MRHDLSIIYHFFVSTTYFRNLGRGVKTILLGYKIRIFGKLQRFLRSFSGTGTKTKSRFLPNRCTDRNQAIQYRHRKVLIMTFFRPVLTGPFRSVQVLCQDWHTVLVPVPLKDRKKRFISPFGNLIIKILKAFIFL